MRVARAMFSAAVAVAGACTSGTVLDPASPDATVATDAAPVPDVAFAEVAVDAGAAPLHVARRDLEVTPVGSVRQPAVAFHPGSGAFVAAYTWVTQGLPDAPLFRVEARALVVGAGGALAVSDPFTVDGDAPAHNADAPAVAATDRDDLPALVVWADDRAEPGGRGAVEVYGRFIRARGGATPSITATGEPFDVSLHAGTNEALPAAAWDRSVGAWLVAWADDRARGVRAEDARVIYARFVSPDGQVGSELRVGDDVLFQTNPSVASCGGGSFLIAWTDYRLEGRALVSQARGRVFDARSGAGLGPIQMWGDAPGSSQDLVAAQCAPDGGWWVAWGVGGPPSIRQLRLARLRPDGVVHAAFSATTRADGARAARIAPVASTGQLLVAHLAQDTSYGYALTLAPGAAEWPDATPLTPDPPRLGTFWADVAASPRGAVAVAVMTLDYDRLRATTFTDD